MTALRDTFISELLPIARRDKNVYLITVDMGAPSLDLWREELPDQFLSAGISEQNAINVAAGLAAEGKRVYVYFMACWAARCFEQIRYSCAMAENPITILGNGVGLGYAPAGPAHEPNEDIAYMRSLLGIEVITPVNNRVTQDLVRLTYEVPALRYIRLERNYATQLVDIYGSNTLSNNFLDMGLSIIKPGLAEESHNNTPKISILSCGYLLGRACEAWELLIEKGYQASVFDLWRVKPIDLNHFRHCVDAYDTIVTVEEQSLSGGFGSAVLEALADLNLKRNILRLGLPERYLFENGSRDFHLNNCGLSGEDIYLKVADFISDNRIPDGQISVDQLYKTLADLVEK